SPGDGESKSEDSAASSKNQTSSSSEGCGDSDVPGTCKKHKQKKDGADDCEKKRCLKKHAAAEESSSEKSSADLGTDNASPSEGQQKVSHGKKKKKAKDKAGNLSETAPSQPA